MKSKHLVLRGITWASGLFLILFSLNVSAAIRCNDANNPINLVTHDGTVVGNIIATVNPNNNNNLIIKINMLNGNTLKNSEVQAGLSSANVATLFSLNKAGNPQIGKFPSKNIDDGHDSSVHSAIPGSFTAGANINLAVHADIKLPNGGSEGAWSKGTQFNSSGSWASYASCTLHQNPVAFDDKYDFFIPNAQDPYPMPITEVDKGVAGNDSGIGTLSVVMDQDLTYDGSEWGSSNGNLVTSNNPKIPLTLNGDGTFNIVFNAPNTGGGITALPGGGGPGCALYYGSFFFKYHVVDSFGAASNVATARIKMVEYPCIAINLPQTILVASTPLVVVNPTINISLPTNTNLEIVSTAPNVTTSQVTYTVLVPNTTTTIPITVNDPAYFSASGTVTTDSLKLEPLTVTGCTGDCAVSGFRTVTSGTQTQGTTQTNYYGMGWLLGI